MPAAASLASQARPLAALAPRPRPAGRWRALPWPALLAMALPLAPRLVWADDLAAVTELRMPAPDVLPELAATGRPRMEVLLRQASALAVQRMEGPQAGTTETVSLETSERMKNGFLSLLVPGLGQFRAGHKTRGAVFAGLEVAIWTSYLVFDVQGHARRNAYQDYAVQFAAVEGTDRNDDYWRAVASFENSDQYNEQVRRSVRAGVEPDGPEYLGSDGWRWQSEQDFGNYQELRKSSNAAFDNAKLVTLLALVNHAAAFVDAVRTSVATKPKMQTTVAGMELKFAVRPALHQSTATLSLQRHF